MPAPAPRRLPDHVDPDVLRTLVHGRPWFHQIDLGDGIVPPGIDRSADKLTGLGLPGDLAGKTVLDVGVYDGFFSFEAYDRPMMVFYPGRSLNDDPSNYWGPNRQGVLEMFYECGWARVDIVSERGDRMVVHAFR